MARLENQEEQGAGFYDFSELMGETESQEEEVRDLDLPEPEKEEKEEEEDIEEGADEELVEDNNSKKETPDEVEEEEEEFKKERSSSQNNYSSLAKKYIELGTWKDAEVEIDGESVTLSELEDLDEETFLEIVKAQDKEKNTEIDKNFINKEDLDDISLKIIEISKNGGDIKDVLKAKETYIDNLNTYNLEDEMHQEDLVRQMYRLDNPKISDKQIDRLVEADKVDLELDAKARDFADNLKKSYHSMLDKKKEEASKLREQEQQNRKTLRKDLREHLTNLGIKNDSALRPLLDSVTKETENGFTVDNQFREMKQNPEELAEFLLWKNNREDYNKLISEKQTSKAKKDTLVKLNIARGKHTEGKKASSKKVNPSEDLSKELKFL